MNGSNKNNFYELLPLCHQLQPPAHVFSKATRTTCLNFHTSSRSYQPVWGRTCVLITPGSGSRTSIASPRRPSITMWMYNAHSITHSRSVARPMGTSHALHNLDRPPQMEHSTRTTVNDEMIGISSCNLLTSPTRDRLCRAHAAAALIQCPPNFANHRTVGLTRARRPADALLFFIGIGGGPLTGTRMCAFLDDFYLISRPPLSVDSTFETVPVMLELAHSNRELRAQDAFVVC